jgi:hypothetical protein
LQEAGQPAFLLYGRWLMRVGSDPTHPADRRLTRAERPGRGKPDPTSPLRSNPSCRSAFAYPMEDQPRLPVTPALVADLVEQAALARRLAIAIRGDPEAQRLVHLAEGG